MADVESHLDFFNYFRVPQNRKEKGTFERTEKLQVVIGESGRVSGGVAGVNLAGFMSHVCFPRPL